MIGQNSREIHRDLTWEGDVFRTALARHVSDADVEVFSDFALNHVDADRIFAFFAENVAQQVFREFKADGLVRERGIGGDTNESAFETSNIGANPGGDELDN